MDRDLRVVDLGVVEGCLVREALGVRCNGGLVLDGANVGGGVGGGGGNICGGTGGGAVIGFEDCATDASGRGMRASRIESVADRMEVSSIFLN